MLYQIRNIHDPLNPLDLGTYEADTPEGALDARAQAQIPPCATYAEACALHGFDPAEARKQLEIIEVG